MSLDMWPISGNVVAGRRYTPHTEDADMSQHTRHTDPAPHDRKPEPEPRHYGTLRMRSPVRPWLVGRAVSLPVCR